MPVTPMLAISGHRSLARLPGDMSRRTMRASSATSRIGYRAVVARAARPAPASVRLGPTTNWQTTTKAAADAARAADRPAAAAPGRVDGALAGGGAQEQEGAAEQRNVTPDVEDVGRGERRIAADQAVG